MTFPRTGQPEWTPAQASPWLPVNQSGRVFDAFSIYAAVADRDLAAPPVTCDDGTCYLVAADPTGDWTGQAGKLALAVGADAANGWIFVTVANEGTRLYVVDEEVTIQYIGGAFAAVDGGTSRLDDLIDVNAPLPEDGDVLTYDSYTNEWFPSPPAVGGVGAETVTESGTAANLLNDNAGKYQRWTNASAKTLTVQPNATEEITQDAEFSLRNVGAGDLTISAGSGVTINAPAGGTLVLETGMTATLKRVAVNEFDLIGQTVAV